MEELLRNSPVSSFIFLITIVTSLYAFYNEGVYGKFMLHPYSVSRGKSLYTFITSGLIHRDWGHLFMNMLSYYFFAFTLEGIIGSWQFGVLYMASLVLSDISTVIKYKDHYAYHSLGASGAVSAVVFSYILFDPLTKFIIFPLPIPIPAVIFGVLYLAYSVYASRQSSSINHDAHFYGALSGIIITIVFYPQVIGMFFSKLGLSH
ncbi:rhomboid family intramembrane serine protease [Pedobacter sp. HMF7647]|uniref:Rhomboid family intramembrane serine protease n=1 Tax=Hufsiella arboris TaxID=2695275 RepID=A0A7K1Y5M7_9SPHI|nr:rhomboid family intramembrane serine protease [Hufsiella arboris]MXV49893.1 rhomboid family intramembrane serine protease [Hufsiella arboris]